jgi:hypothetical protein
VGSGNVEVSDGLLLLSKSNGAVAMLVMIDFEACWPVVNPLPRKLRF